MKEAIIVTRIQNFLSLFSTENGSSGHEILVTRLLKEKKVKRKDYASSDQRSGLQAFELALFFLSFLNLRDDDRFLSLV